MGTPSFWPQTGFDPAHSGQHIGEMQAEMLRLLLRSAAAAYLIWHIMAGPLIDPVRHMVSLYTTGPVVLAVVGGSYALLPKHPRVAAWVFVVGTLVAITWAILAMDVVEIATLYVVAALSAALLIRPVAGLISAACAEGLLWLVVQVRPDLVNPWEFWRIAAISVLGVGAVWILTSQLLLVLNWYVNSYALASHKRREANEHRAELVKARRQLEEANYRLQKANAALEVALKAADEAERSKMEFAANVSHEFRTPLNLIIGYSEMIMTSPASYGGAGLPAAYRGDINAIYRSAEHLLALADDVLDLATMEVGRLSLVREPVDLRQLAHDAVALVRDFVEAKSLNLQLNLPQELPLVMADRLRVRQILLNLLTNAVRFTDRGTIELAVAEAEDHVVVRVADTGEGMAPDELSRLFQRFTNADKGKGSWHAGSGLGLAISKHMVELHDGKMGVESEKGIGTTFWFTLPVTPLPWAAKAVHGARSVLGPSGYRPIAVLAVPDRALATLLQRHLAGFEVELADGLAQATARASELGAVAVIVDPDYCEEESTPWTLVPVIKCPLPHSQGLARRLGVAAALVKPISRQALLDTVRSLDCPCERVLIVDDDPRFARLLSRIIAAGYPDCTLTMAHNGAEALERIAADRPNLVLLDLVMPTLDGFSVLEQLANNPSLADTKIITISAHQAADQAAPLGPELQITKPGGFQLAELMDVLGAALSKLAPAREALIDRAQVRSEAPPETPAWAGKRPRREILPPAAPKEPSTR